jgi:N-acetylmuramoyl-L-alanine amidase
MSQAKTRRISTTLGTLFLLANAPALAAQGRPVIMVDPGHGGEQAGARGGGLVEKDLVLPAAFRLSEALAARGYDVRLTRSADTTLPNPDRRAAAEAAGAALMISLHFNQNADSTRRGIEIYGNLEDAKVTDLANRLATALRADGTPVVVVARSNTFLNSPTVPTVMIEAGFLTNPVERERIPTEAYQRELASRIVAATVAFLSP